MSGFFGASSGLPVGSKIEIFSKVVPKGYLLCDGARVSKTQYAKLFAVIGDSFKRLTNEYGDVLVQDSAKFWLPDLTISKFLSAGRKRYESVISYLGGSSEITTNNVDPHYILSVLRTNTNSSSSSSILEHSVKSSGKFFIAARLKNIVVQVGGVAQAVFLINNVANTAGQGLLVSFEFYNVGGVVKMQNVRAIKDGVPVQSFVALENVVWNRQDIIFYFDIDNKTIGFYVNNDQYAVATILTTLASYKAITQLFCTLNSSIEVGFLPDSEIAVIPSGYKNLFELPIADFIFNESLGVATHSHTVGGTALTIDQMPAHTHLMLGVVANNSNTSGGSPNDVPVANNGNIQTQSTGSGQTHNHTLTTTSNLPPHVTAMFAIKYK